MNTSREQTGVALMGAIFLIVVLAGLGAYMATLSGTQHFTNAYAVQGSRAYHAARSGIEWGIYRAVTDGDCSSFPSTFSYSSGGLDGFEVTVTCSLTTHTERSVTYNIYSLEADSKRQGSGFGDVGYVNRVVRVVVTDAS